MLGSGWPDGWAGCLLVSVFHVWVLGCSVLCF